MKNEHSLVVINGKSTNAWYTVEALRGYFHHLHRTNDGNVLRVMVCKSDIERFDEELLIAAELRRASRLTGRHTFCSVVTLANNVSLENIAKMVGHTNTRMTQRYAKVLDQSILRDIQGVKEKFCEVG